MISQISELLFSSWLLSFIRASLWRVLKFESLLDILIKQKALPTAKHSQHHLIFPVTHTPPPFQKDPILHFIMHTHQVYICVLLSVTHQFLKCDLGRLQGHRYTTTFVKACCIAVFPQQPTNSTKTVCNFFCQSSCFRLSQVILRFSALITAVYHSVDTRTQLSSNHMLINILRVRSTR